MPKSKKEEGPEDPFSDPEWLAYADRAIKELLPKMQRSAVMLSLVPQGPTDVKYALELGFMIMLDKPIICVVPPGVRVPGKLIGVADAIVEGDITDESMGKRLSAEIDRVMKEKGLS